MIVKQVMSIEELWVLLLNGDLLITYWLELHGQSPLKHQIFHTHLLEKEDSLQAKLISTNATLQVTWGQSGEGCAIASPGYGIINIDGVTTGNLNLKEEEGDSYSIGIAWEPVDRLLITIDAFHIQLADIVSTKDLGSIVRDEAICRAQEAGDTSAGTINYP